MEICNAGSYLVWCIVHYLQHLVSHAANGVILGHCEV